MICTNLYLDTKLLRILPILPVGHFWTRLVPHSHSLQNANHTEHNNLLIFGRGDIIPTHHSALGTRCPDTHNNGIARAYIDEAFVVAPMAYIDESPCRNIQERPLNASLSVPLALSSGGVDLPFFT